MKIILNKFKESEWYNIVKEHSTIIVYIITALVTIGTLLIKISQFFYMYGVFSFWNIPISLINIDVSIFSFLNAFFIILLNVFCVYTFIYSREVFHLEKQIYIIKNKLYHKNFTQKFGYLFEMYFIFTFKFIYITLTNIVFLFCAFKESFTLKVLITSILITFIQYFSSFAFLNYKQKKKNKNKLEKIKLNVTKEEILKINDELSQHEIVIKKLFSRFLIWVSMVTILFITFLSFYYGYNGEKDKENFYIAKKYNDKIVIYQDNSKFILMEINKNKLNNTYEVVPINEIGILQYEKIGKVSLKK